MVFFLDREELAERDYVTGMRGVVLTGVVNYCALVQVKDKEALHELRQREDLVLLLLLKCCLKMPLDLITQGAVRGVSSVCEADLHSTGKETRPFYMFASTKVIT